MGEEGAARRMTKQQRREQLLQTAYEIIREEGTDALTLGRLAERAGVSKPIAYEHFGSRAGLLIALYRDYDERQTRAMRDALAGSGGTIEDVASIISAAYVDCAVMSGPEFAAITAALSGSDEMEELLQSCRDSFLEDCHRALAPFTTLPPAQSRTLLVGILGAADALSEAAASGRTPRGEAVDALVRLMTTALSHGPGALSEKHSRST